MYYEDKQGDLIVMADAGQFDHIVHGCNCQNVMRSGIAKALVDRWPEVYEYDTQYSEFTTPGAKLGTFSGGPVVARTGDPLIVTNIYSQFTFGRDPKRYVSYDAIANAFEALVRSLDSPDHPGPELRFGIPWLGAGLGGGYWPAIKQLIIEAFADYQKAHLTFVEYRK